MIGCARLGARLGARGCSLARFHRRRIAEPCSYIQDPFAGQRYYVQTDTPKHNQEAVVNDDDVESCFRRVDMSFQKTQECFKSKTNWELLRGLMVLKLCSIKWLVNHNMEIMKLARKVLGKRLFRTFMKATFYGHFVAGENEEDLKPTIAKMSRYGVKAILDYSVEADLSENEAVEKTMSSKLSTQDEQAGQTPEESSAFIPKQSRYQPHTKFGDRRKGVISARTYFYTGEPECDKNANIFMNCIDEVEAATGGAGFAAIKLTALGRPQFLLQLSEAVAQTQSFYRVLTGCDWGNLMQSRLSKDDLLRKLEEFGVKTDTTAVGEWFDQMDFDSKGFVDIYKWSRLLDQNMQLSKLFKVINLKSGQLEPLIGGLKEEEEKQFGNMMDRLRRIADKAAKTKIRIMVDAEQTYFQPAISRIALELMRRYNQQEPVFFNTYQCYLKNALHNISIDLQLCRRENLYFGAKLVRGAYMDQERSRAEALGYEDPINPNFQATSEMYHAALRTVIHEVSRRNPGQISVMLATHNEDTIRYTLNVMRDAGIGPSKRVLCFGQLYGMCDQITYSLGQAGYSAYKYVPYGPVDEVLPYLSRRAQENSSIMMKAQRERKLMFTELRRRLQMGQLYHPPAEPKLQTV